MRRLNRHGFDSWLYFAMMCVGEWWVDRVSAKVGTINFRKYHDIFTSYF
jgi:hypothetical protein